MTGDLPNTLAEAEVMLAEASAEIEAINGQLSSFRTGAYDASDDWRRKAVAALGWKRHKAARLKAYIKALRRETMEDMVSAKKLRRVQKQLLEDRAKLKLACDMVREVAPERLTELYDRLHGVEIEHRADAEAEL